MFYGLGSDGTVSANKATIRIIGHLCIPLVIEPKQRIARDDQIELGSVLDHRTARCDLGRCAHANPHIWGAPGSANPVLHLRRIEGSTWFDAYRRSFDDVWETAIPIVEAESDRQAAVG